MTGRRGLAAAAENQLNRYRTFRKRGETVTRRVFQVPVCACLVIAALAVAPATPAGRRQDPPEAKKGDRDKEADEQYRREAEALAAGIEVEVRVDDKWAKVKRIEKPLLLYGDATRANDRGSVWGWGDKGRPVALLELFQNPDTRERWTFVVCNTSGGRLRATRGGAAWWRENESATELKDVPGAPAPAADAAQRQRQLKQLAQKFTGHEFWDPNNSRYELRRLDRPLHTYSDEAGGVLDGGLFTLANGTNPEIVLFVEARAGGADGSKPAWRFAVGRLAHAELHLEYDGKEVFEAPRGNRAAGADKPYWLGFIDAKPEK